MTITINSSDYTKAKKVEIDGQMFELRPMNSSETIAWLNLAADMQDAKDKKDMKAFEKTLNKFKDMYFGFWDKPEEAKKILGNLSVDDWLDIYQKVMKEG